MSLYNISGTRLTEAFRIFGGALRTAYSLTGAQLWQADGQKNFPDAHRPFVDWRFKMISSTANMSYTSTAEAVEDFDDSEWDSVTIPHDWSIYQNFNAKSPATYEGGFLDGGDAWYRCKVYASDEMLTSKTLLYFEAVYMECAVYLNGTKVGEHSYGYAPFALDVSGTLKKGKNTLAVFVRNRQPGCRWYSGSGIFRPCYLLVMEKNNVAVTNIHVTSEGLEAEHEGVVNTKISFDLTSATAGSAVITAEISHNGETVGHISATETLTKGEQQLTLIVPVEKPALWDIGDGQLYQAVIHVKTGDRTTDSYPATFGYRWTKWDVDTGFWLNGKNIKLKGVCMHHDLGCIGAEANRSAMNRQIDSMVAMGANAIRLTHNPGSRMFLDLCMQKGVLVVEELFDCWTVAKKTYDFARFYPEHYQEVVRDTLRRDWNDPEIIIWSIGNEINRTANYTAEQVRPIVTALIAEVKKYDTTRPVTMGEDSPAMDAAKVCMELLDVCGINYSNNDLSVPHGLSKPSYGSETTSALSSRGVYARDDTGYQCSSFDDDKVHWGSYAADALRAHMESTYSCGMFVWTGWDYIGEPTPFDKYPAKSSYFGICDLAGIPKDIYYMYQSRWTTDPMVHILPMNWDSWTVGSTVPVWLYSNCSSVELFQDGVSLGKKTQSDIGEKFQFAYSVTYAKGVLTAKGYDATGAVVATDEVKSSDGTPAKLSLTAYKQNVDVGTDDLVFVICDVQDKDDIRVSTANTKITFTCTGGTVLGTDNGNAACVEPMRTNVKTAFNGKVLCVCRHDGKTGTLTVTATADGLTAGSVNVEKMGG